MTPSTLLSPLLTYCADLPGFSRHAIEVAETEQRIATVLSALTVQTELLFDANAQLNAMRKDRDALLARIAELEPLAECAAIMAVSGYFSRMRGPIGHLVRNALLGSEDFVRGEAYELDDCEIAVPLYAGSAPVPAAQDFSLMQGGYCCECGHELCDTCAPLHPIMPWPAAQAESKVADDVDLWKFCRDALKRGAEIESQFSQQGYETFIAEIECAAKKEEKRLRAMLAAKAKEGS